VFFVTCINRLRECTGFQKCENINIKKIGVKVSFLSVSVLIPCRDGEHTIVDTVSSLLHQTVKVHIIVVDDHSIDKTLNLLETFSIRVITYPHREPKNYRRIPMLLNMGLSILPDNEYYMISGDDNVFPPTYMERVIRFMEEYNVDVASGYNENSNYHEIKSPTGSGRIFSKRFWYFVTPFPENIGWESRCVYRAWQLGFRVGVYPVPKSHTRQRNRRLTQWGQGAYLNGYTFPWMLLRSLLSIHRGEGVLNSFAMLAGYLGYMVQHREKNDVSDFIYRHQIQNIASYLLPFVSRRDIDVHKVRTQ
jgi:glycosyltransferase involved in cell wall biosynthesis